MVDNTMTTSPILSYYLKPLHLISKHLDTLYYSNAIFNSGWKRILKKLGVEGSTFNSDHSLPSLIGKEDLIIDNEHPDATLVGKKIDCMKRVFTTEAWEIMKDACKCS